tara:strand:+ start:812 stop:1645 length:834 start_codon:yes stop_codon:yes gene_type:complete
MMELGIFSKHIERPVMEETFDAIRFHGLTCVQFNFETAGLDTMPSTIEKSVCNHIREQMELRGVSLAAISGTFNMIHPDLYERQQGIERLQTMIHACPDLDNSVITLCTGTRDPMHMWNHHPDNNAPEAWDDLIESLEQVLPHAEKNNVILAFEPEVANVVDSCPKARRLLDQINSPHLGVVIDGANIYHKGELPIMEDLLYEAFDLLSDDIALAHAKDLDHDGEAGNLAAGTGLLDYDLYLSLLSKLETPVPLILHGLEEEQVPDSIAFLKDTLEN